MNAYMISGDQIVEPTQTLIAGGNWASESYWDAAHSLSSAAEPFFKAAPASVTVDPMGNVQDQYPSAADSALRR
jgi:hypothetical protein